MAPPEETVLGDGMLRINGRSYPPGSGCDNLQYGAFLTPSSEEG